jgi:DNA-directed RNA polymerase specialized sigma24 family protein
MDVDTAQAIIRTQCDAHNAAEPLRRSLEREVPALLRTSRMYVRKAGVAEGGDIASAALEVLSRVTVEALKSPGKFDPARRPTAWLLGIAVNIIRRMQRERGKAHAREVLASQLAGGAADEDGDDDYKDERNFSRDSLQAQRRLLGREALPVAEDEEQEK